MSLAFFTSNDAQRREKGHKPGPVVRNLGELAREFGVFHTTLIKLMEQSSDTPKPVFGGKGRCTRGLFDLQQMRAWWKADCARRAEMTQTPNI